MDCRVWTNRFSGAAYDHWCTGRKSGNLDFASPVSVCMLPVRDLPVDWRCFKADWNGIADAIHLVPYTGSTQKGRMMGDSHRRAFIVSR